MAARSRITVLLLLFLLSTEHSFAVTEDELTPLVKQLLSNYGVDGMFSLAVSIPLNQNQIKNQNQNQGANRNIEEVLGNNPADDVKNKINMNEVYVGSRMVAAKKRENYVDHAESRVVDKLNQLYNSPPVNKHDLLLFYVYASPCIKKCTNKDHPGNILKRIKYIRNWNDYAFVFSKPFKPKDGSVITDAEHRDSLERLGEQIGLKNIFRCDRDQNKQMKCVSCSSSSGNVAQRCVSDTNTGQQQGTGGSSAQGGAQANRNSGRGASSSQGGDQDGWQTPKKGKGDRVRRDISYNAGDSSAHISESNKGAEDAPSVDENGNDVATGESVSLSPTGSDEGNGSDLRTVEDILSPHNGFDSGDGRVSKGKGKVSKGKGGKGRRGKGKGKKCSRLVWPGTGFLPLIFASDF